MDCSLPALVGVDLYLLEPPQKPLFMSSASGCTHFLSVPMLEVVVGPILQEEETEFKEAVMSWTADAGCS